MLRCPKKQLIKLCWNRHPLNKCQLSTFPRYCIGTESIQSVTYGFCPPWVYKQLLIGLVSLKPPCGDKWQKQNAGSHWSCQKGFSFESHSPECVAFLVAQLVKESTCSVKTWVWSLGGNVPWGRERLPNPVFWPAEFHGLYSPWGCKKSDTTECDFHFLSLECIPIFPLGCYLHKPITHLTLFKICSQSFSRV